MAGGKNRQTLFYSILPATNWNLTSETALD